MHFWPMLVFPGFATKILPLCCVGLCLARPASTSGSPSRSTGKAPAKKIELEIGGRVGSLYGDPVDEESWYYDRIGARIVDADGNRLTLEPVVRGVGLELNAWLRHSQVVRVGAGFEMESYRIHPLDFEADSYERDFLEQKSFLFKVRALPFEFAGIRIGFEANGGLAIGSLRRYGLAFINSNDTARVVWNRGYTGYTLDGNRPIDIMGTRLGFCPMLRIPVTERFGLVAKGDFHWVMWNMDVDDPLNRYPTSLHPGYPRGLGARGVDFALLLSAVF